MQKLLVTGGQGMVGRNLRAHPDMARWQVLAPSSGQLDLRDGPSVRRYLALHRPDAVVHAAGVVGGIHQNLSEPMRFLSANLQIGLNVVTACHEAGIGTLINLSSSCVYPKDLGQGLAEDRILTGALEPSNEGYALAKIATMRLCENAMREDPDLRYLTLVPCNLYGPWDKFDPQRSHLLAAIIHKIHRAKKNGLAEVEIWGAGTARREFMFAGDLADAIMKVLDDPQAVPPVMNIGVGADHSINDYYRLVAGVIGWSGRFRHDLTRPVGMQRKLLDIGLQQQWGWAPPTSLAEGVRRTYEFYLQEQLS